MKYKVGDCVTHKCYNGVELMEIDSRIVKIRSERCEEGQYVVMVSKKYHPMGWKDHYLARELDLPADSRFYNVGKWTYRIIGFSKNHLIKERTKWMRLEKNITEVSK